MVVLTAENIKVEVRWCDRHKKVPKMIVGRILSEIQCKFAYRKSIGARKEAQIVREKRENRSFGR